MVEGGGLQTHHVVNGCSYDVFLRAPPSYHRRPFCLWIPLAPEGSMTSTNFTLEERSMRLPGILLTYLPVLTPFRSFSVHTIYILRANFTFTSQVCGEPPGSEHYS